MSLPDFAKLVDIPYTTLKGLESAGPNKKPSFDVVAKIRKACPELNVDWLFDEGDTEPMIRDGRALTRVTPAPTETPEPGPTRPASPAMLIIPDVSNMPVEKQAEYWQAKWEKAARQLAEEASAREHEELVQELTSSKGGRSFAETSADAADTDYTPPVMVAETNLEFVEQAREAERARIGFLYGSLR